MSLQPSTLAELQSLQFMLIDNNLPQTSVIKPSQENISLTYTASMENVSVENLDFSSILEIEDLQTSIEHHSIPSRNSQIVKRYFINSKLRQNWSNKDVFKKKTTLNIAHLELLLDVDHYQQMEHKRQTIKPQRTFIRSNNSGLYSVHKQAQDYNKNQLKTHTKIKDLFNPEKPQNMESSSMTRSTRSYSMKNSNLGTRKINFSNKKLCDKRILSCQTQRRYNRLPLIKGSNFHKSAPASLGKNRKIVEYQENVQLNDTFVVGKTYRLRENNEKAKKYLKKVIENRNSIIHFSDNKKNKLIKDFKQNYEEW